MGKCFNYENLRLKDLKLLARGLKVPGSHEMVKAQLVPILSKLDAAGNCVKASGIMGGNRPGAVEKELSDTIKVKKVLTVKESVPAKKPASSKPAAAKTSPDDAGLKRSRSDGSLKKSQLPTKKVVSKRPSTEDSNAPLLQEKNPPGSESAKPKIVRSRLNVSPSPPIKISEPQEGDEKKVKKRRGAGPKREDVSVIQTVSAHPSGNESKDGSQELPASKADVLKQRLLSRKSLETPSSGINGRDRIVLQVCGPFWLHAWWEISGNLVARVRAAMGHLWHTSDPVIRLYRVRYDSAGGRSTEFVSDALIRGGIYNWFLNVDNPPNAFLVEIGYRTRDNQFFSLVSSNTVETPHNYIQESMGWSESGWNMLTASAQVSPFENDEPAASASLEDPALEPVRERTALFRRFALAVDAEVVIKGKTSPDAQLTIRGERVWLREDGSFLVRYHLPDRRHVFPVVAVSHDGIDTKTTVLSVERNTKNLETVVRSQNDDD